MKSRDSLEEECSDESKCGDAGKSEIECVVFEEKEGFPGNLRYRKGGNVMKKKPFSNIFAVKEDRCDSGTSGDGMDWEGVDLEP